VDVFILIIGFIGGWLLFAGSMFQAWVELAREGRHLDRASLFNDMPPVEPASSWWWLFPPAKLLIDRHRRDAAREKLLHALPPEALETIVSFKNAAAAWQFVAVGGICLALKETYDLGQMLDWNPLLYVLVVALMLFLSIGHVLLRKRRSTEMVRASTQIEASGASETD
jgi:hypothetical protein